MTQNAIMPTKPHLLAATARRAVNGARGLGERWAALRRTLALWRERARSRADLDRIPAHRLNDLPFDKSMISSERNKPFWRA